MNLFHQPKADIEQLEMQIYQFQDVSISRDNHLLIFLLIIITFIKQ